MPPRIPDNERNAILADIQTGQMSRNAIGRKHHRAPSTITAIATEAGLTDAFDRSETENATKAKLADNARSRADLGERFLAEAHAALDDLHTEHLAFSFGGRDNTYADKILPKPPPAERRNIMIIAATAADKHMAIDKHDQKAGSDTVGSLLGAMFDDLTSRYGVSDNPDPG